MARNLAAFLAFTLVYFISSAVNSSADNVELKYRRPVCSHAYQELFQLPFTNFRLLSASNLGENEKFFRDFSINHAGKVRCSSTNSEERYNLHVFDLNSLQSFDVCLDTFETGSVVFESPHYEAVIDSCRNGKPIDGLDNIKLFSPQNSSIVGYKLVPTDAPFHIKLQKSGTFSIVSSADCANENSYSLYLEVSVATSHNEVHKAFTDIEIRVGQNQRQLSRRRRSTGNQDLILLEESVSENTAFPNFDVLEALASESGTNPITSFSWVNIKYDDVIEVAETNSQLIVRQKSGTTIDREIQNPHRLEFNVRDENTKELYKVRFVLEVLDVDDTAPEIINERMPLVGFVPLDVQPGVQILQLTIRDPDDTPVDSNEREWTIQIGVQNLFLELSRNTIKPLSETETVWIRTKPDIPDNLLDKVYTFPVILRDQSNNRAEYQVKIYVGDPFLIVYPIPDIIYINEDLPRGTLVYKVKVETGSSSSVRFEFNVENDNNEFTFDKYVGEIFTNKQFDRDADPLEISSFQITLIVSDEISDDVERSFQIQVVDVNDKRPVFNPTVYYTTIPENYSPNEPISFNGDDFDAVSATDADSTAPNNEIYYTIDSNVPFIVNPVTGQVFANGIDYEATVNGLIDPFTIVAHDKGIDGAKEARAEVNIQISNVNDEAPVFDVQTEDDCLYEYSVRQTVDQGFQLGTVSAFDPDGNEVNYQIIALTTLPFSLDTTSGIITRSDTVNNLLTEEQYEFEVEAYEQVDDGGSSICKVVVNVEGENANDPEFVNCPNGLTTMDVDEGSELGTSIDTLSATDNDLGLSGRLTFEIQSTDWFSIERSVAQSGVTIGTLKVNSPNLDREEKALRCVFVFVRDGYDEPTPAKNYRQAACEVCVTVKDIPDTKPAFFNTGNLEVTVLVSNQANHPFITVRAYDADSVENAITYSIGQSSFSDFFDINPVTGDLFNTKSLVDLKAQANAVDLEVVATDESGDEATLGVFVIIDDSQDTRSRPTFTNTNFNGGYKFSLKEDSELGNIAETTMKVELAESDGSCTWSLQNGETSSTNKDKEFFDLSGLSPQQLKLVKDLDFESIEEFEFFVRCRDSQYDYLETLVRISIIVEDVNDEFPKFVDQDRIFTVYQSSDPGVVIGTLDAIDGDEDTAFRYSIEANPGNDPYFQIDQSSGTITVSTPPTGEGSWQGVARVDDSVTSSHSAPGNDAPNEGAMSLTIRILDVNDNAPVVLPIDQAPPYTIGEAANVGTLVAGFRAEDIDTDPAQSFTFSFSSDSPNVPFVMNNLNGQGLLMVSEPLDVDVDNPVTQYTLKIEVFDNVQSSEPYEVVVNVVNSDDEPPVFTSSNSFNITEEDSSLVDTVVFTVSAVNNDAVSGANAIIYSLSGSGAEETFAIDNTTGDITLLRVVDREAPGENEFVLLVSAKEEASDLTSLQQLFVTVVDINDHSPYFPEDKRGFIKENSAVGDEVIKIFAFDDDLDGPPSNFGSIVKYSKILDEGSCGNLFDIDDDGKISVATSGLDRESLPPEMKPNDECTLVVEAIDGGTPANSGRTLITIVIEDEDDIGPVFENTNVAAEIDEQTLSSRLVYGLYVIDGDTPAENRKGNQVELITNNVDYPDYGLFKVRYDPERNMVEIINAEPLTFVELGNAKTELKIQVLIQATIDGTTESSTANCVFTLVDWNNHAPVVSIVTPIIRPIPLSEGLGFQRASPIATVSATDVDAEEGNPNRGYNWYIEWSSDPHGRFEVVADPDDTHRANVYQTEPLDFEIVQQRTMSLQVCAQDLPDELFKPRLSGCTEIGIQTTNINDACPLFQDFPVFTVPENQNEEVVIFESIQATDFDDDGGTQTPSLSVSVISMDTSVFHNSDVDNGNMRLVKKSGITLDRETKEFYEIELSVCDSDDTTCRNEKTCRQTVFIRVTDVNDNEQSDGGSSNILLFNTEELLSRQVDLENSIFVQDLDCCSNQDKTFSMTSGSNDLFQIESDGQFVLSSNVTQGSYNVEVGVTENDQTVKSTVTVQVNLVTQEMIDHMITLKLMDVSADNFVGSATYFGRVEYYSRLRNLLKNLLNIGGSDQVVIFTMRESDDDYEINYDRPYHLPELDIGLVVYQNDKQSFMSPVYLNAILSRNRVDLSTDLGIAIAEVNVDECESIAGNTDCYTFRGVKSVDDASGDVITAGSSPRFSLVTPTLVIQPVLSDFYADNDIQRLFDVESNVCLDSPCKHGGECFPEYGDFSTLVMRYTFRCECVPGFTGPRCEKEDRTFKGTGDKASYAVLEPLVLYRTNQHLSFDFMTEDPNGLLLYDGPMDEPYDALREDYLNGNEDFIAVELINGTVQLQVNAGCETLVLENGSNMNDGEKHHVDIFIDGHDVVLRLDYCASATIEETEFKSHVIREDVCEVSGMIPGCGNEISTPAPLQLGGLMGEPSHYQTLGVTQTNFDGVISNVQNNGYLYDLYEPVVSEASVSGNLKTQAFCFEGENAVCRGNAKCVANMERLLYCDCAVGTFGDRCQFSQQPHYFSENSFILFNVDATSAGRKKRSIELPYELTNVKTMDLSISFRTTQEDPILFEVRNSREYDFFRLKLVDGIPSAEISLGSYLINEIRLNDAENAVASGVWAADGNVHTIRLSKFNNFITLSMDGGGALKQKSSQDSLFNEFRIDPSKVAVGGWPVYDQQTGQYRVASGFVGCVSDLRVNGKSLAVSASGSHQSDDSISVTISQNVEAGCDKDPCLIKQANDLTKCPQPRTRCVNWFDTSLCTCILGTRYDLTNEICLNINECELDVCLNGAQCTDVDPHTNNDGKKFQCSCADGYRGITCAATAAAVSRSSLSIAAGIIILVALLILLLLICAFCCRLYWRKNRRSPLDKQVIISDDYDDQRLGSGFYEGGGERDQEYYNIYPLMKPTEHVIITANGPQYVVDDEPNPQFDYIQNPLYQQPNGNVNQGYVPDPDEQPPPYLGNPDKPIEEILGQRVQMADNAAHGRGADCLMVYHYEGEGSDVGTLSTVNTSPAHPPDWSQFNQWQYDPRFARVAEMFNEGESDRE